MSRVDIRMSRLDTRMSRLDIRMSVPTMLVLTIAVTLHNPREPANIRSNSFKIPLGHSTNVYITPKARQIDESGENLLEDQRGCRMNEDNKALDIFQVYTYEACMLECKIRQSYQRCGCFPWDYLVTKVVVSTIPTSLKCLTVLMPSLERLETLD